MASTLAPWATHTPTFATRAVSESASSTPPARPASGDHRENRRPASASTGPPTSAFRHSATGTKGVSQVTTVLLA